MAMSTDTACSQDVSCSQQTQTTITTSVIGTQCALMVLTNASSQTEEEFPVLDVDHAQVSASEKFPASEDGTDVLATADPHSCSCHPPSSRTGFFSNVTEDIQFGGKLYSGPSCHQRNHQTTHVKVGASKMPNICTVCKKVFRKRFALDTHMRVHTAQNPPRPIFQTPARLANDTRRMHKKSGRSSSGADGILHGRDAEHEAASMEVVGSSWRDMGSARGLLPPRSATRQGAILHSEENVENESLFIQGPASSPLQRRRGEVPQAAVSNSWQRPPVSKRQHWSNSWFTQLTVVTVLLVMAGLTAKICLSLDSSTYEQTDGEAEQGFGGQDVNGTGHNDSFFLSTVDSPNQTRLEETVVSAVRKIKVEGGLRLNSEFSSEPRVRAPYTGRGLETYSPDATDGATFMVKRKASAVPVSPVLSLLAANSKRKDDQPSRPHWLEPKENWVPYWGNRT